jgi:RNA-splicing ligase RtcB
MRCLISITDTAFPSEELRPPDVNEGVISPGGVGFDIACGVRIIRTDIEFQGYKREDRHPDG